MMRAIWKCLAITLLCSGSLATRAETPELGEKAADFTLSTPDGRRLRLSELAAKGNVALIVLRGFPGYQCPYCQKQVHDFIANADKFAATGTQILLVYPGRRLTWTRKQKRHWRSRIRCRRTSTWWSTRTTFLRTSTGYDGMLRTRRRTLRLF